MSDSFNLEIVNPEKLFLSLDNVSEVVVPAFEGDMGILKDHISIISFLKPGIVKVFTGNEVKELYVEDGIIEFSENSLSILTSRIIDIKKIKKDDLSSMINEANEALKDEKDFEKVRKELSCYLLANMTEFGKSKLFNYKELEQFGYNIVIYPVTTQRLAMKNVEDGLRDIYVNGHQNNIIDKMQTRKRLYELVDYEKYNSLDEKIYNFSTEGHE